MPEPPPSLPDWETGDWGEGMQLIQGFPEPEDPILDLLESWANANQPGMPTMGMTISPGPSDTPITSAGAGAVSTSALPSAAPLAVQLDDLSQLANQDGRDDSPVGNKPGGGGGGGGGIGILSGDADLPFVTVAAINPIAAEDGTIFGTFYFTRSPNTYPQAVTVNYTVHGTATNGVDYATLNGVVTIPGGLPGYAVVAVNAINDSIPEPVETVRATIKASPSYRVGVPNTDTVFIIDNDGAWTPVGGERDSEH